MTLTPDEEQRELREHCELMIDLIVDGYLIPFFGAGVNLSNRPLDAHFSLGQYLPDSDELSEIIAKQFNYKWEERNNLPRVSWHASATVGHGKLYRELHEIFSADYPLTDVHKFFARLPGRLRRKGYHGRHQLIVTTNYDDLLERAFDEEREEYDLLSYVAHNDTKHGGEVGKFRYMQHGGESRVLYDPEEIDPFIKRTVILKIHGAVDKANWKRSSFVITEDDYLDYLGRMNIDSYQIPAVVMEKMLDAPFLFLGYSLGDWNLKVLFNSIAANRSFDDKSWAIMNKTKPWDKQYWQSHKVELKELSLKAYIAALNERLDALPDVS